MQRYRATATAVAAPKTEKSAQRKLHYIYTTGPKLPTPIFCPHATSPSWILRSKLCLNRVDQNLSCNLPFTGCRNSYSNRNYDTLHLAKLGLKCCHHHHHLLHLPTLPAVRPHVQTIAPIAFKFSTVLQYINISRRFFSFFEIPINSCFLMILRKHLVNFLEQYLRMVLMSKPLLRLPSKLLQCFNTLISPGVFLVFSKFLLIPVFDDFEKTLSKFS